MSSLSETDKRNIYRFGQPAWVGEKIRKIGKVETVIGAAGSVITQGLTFLADAANSNQEFTDRFGNFNVWQAPGIVAVSIALIGVAQWLLGRRIENGAVDRALARKYRTIQQQIER